METKEKYTKELHKYRVGRFIKTNKTLRQNTCIAARHYRKDEGIKYKTPIRLICNTCFHFVGLPTNDTRVGFLCPWDILGEDGAKHRMRFELNRYKNGD